MGRLEARVARLEAALAGPARMYTVEIGEHDDVDEAVARLLPDARPEDLVVIVRRFADADTPAQRLR